MRAPGRRDLATAGSAVTAGSRPVEQAAMRGRTATVQFWRNRSGGSCATDGTFRWRLTFHEKSTEDALGSTRRRDAGAAVIQPANRAVSERMSNTVSSLPTVSITRFAFSRDQWAKAAQSDRKSTRLNSSHLVISY